MKAQGRIKNRLRFQFFVLQMNIYQYMYKTCLIYALGEKCHVDRDSLLDYAL